MEAELLESERALRSVMQVVPLQTLGERVRAHRLAGGLSVRQLAARAMLSKTSIVSLEHGRSCQPATLAKVCAALSLHVDRLSAPGTEDQSEPAVLRLGEYRWYDLEETSGGPLAVGTLSLEQRESFRKGELNAVMTMFRNIPGSSNVLAGIIELSGSTPTRSHPGGEFVYVLAGAAQITIGESEVELQPGESVYIESMAPHRYGLQAGSEGTVSLLVFRLG